MRTSLYKLLDIVNDFDQPASVRKDALEQLSRYYCDEAFGASKKAAVVDPDLDVRRTAIHFLFKEYGTHIVMELIRNLNHRNPKVVINVLHGLCQIGRNNHRDIVLQAVIKCLKNPNPNIQKVAVESVQKLSGKEKKYNRPYKPVSKDHQQHEMFSNADIVSSEAAFL